MNDIIEHDGPGEIMVGGGPTASSATHMLVARQPIDWDKEPLGLMADIDLSEHLGVSVTMVRSARVERGILSHRDTIRNKRARQRAESRRHTAGKRKVITTMYLRRDQKEALEALSSQTGMPEAELVRRCLDIGLGLVQTPVEVPKLELSEKPVHIR